MLANILVSLKKKEEERRKKEEGRKNKRKVDGDTKKLPRLSITPQPIVPSAFVYDILFVNYYCQLLELPYENQKLQSRCNYLL
ncbi:MULTISPECIES: hypothetical protein [Okeania]|uniref:hypothetical protein n=1 Tax=Okeania TaxID=1458928 RepID=UPI000F53220D|nr:MULTISPECIES: hypothetical protein [Okeania]NES89393.1 hypothetical protein [Okeania sp. SIO2B9]NET21371.1 hypothetical protein [Okeania sp. SIO1H5]NET78025.1 hypothetical protein [Okeania sp. SIO1F9]NET94522.1 hypothetical protein [Okeania sp. SIO1H2]